MVDRLCWWPVAECVLTGRRYPAAAGRGRSWRTTTTARRAARSGAARTPREPRARPDAAEIVSYSLAFPAMVEGIRAVVHTPGVLEGSGMVEFRRVLTAVCFN